MSDILPFPLAKNRAQAILRALPSERVFFTRHAKTRMSGRGISVPDVLDCLQKGRITEGPASMPRGSWRMTVSWFRAGQAIVAVVEIDEDAEGVFSIVVTAMD
jgi:hypothetical protein